ncbi:phosphatidylglycerophosphatase A family protein [Collimonas arenae]|nr:phosphatidylglycerophosphatase A family protein [Collimonas arenae]
MTTPENSTAPRPIKATGRFMLAHPAHIIAQGFGSGLSPVMPGTFGTLFAWLSYVVMTTRWPEIFTPLNWLVITAAGFVVGVWTCQVTGRHLRAPITAAWCGMKSLRSGWCWCW